MTDLEIVKRCALAMGWEAFDVGYVGTDDESPRQRELGDWMESVDLASVGEYWISVKDDVWIEREYFDPLTNDAQAFAFVEKFQLCLQPPHFDPFHGWHVWKEPKPNCTGIDQNLKRAICLCVSALPPALASQDGGK